MKFTLLAGVAVSALLFGAPALAQATAPDQAELASLVRAQAGEIAALRARLDAIEGARPAPSFTPGPAAALQVPRMPRSEVVGDDVPTQIFATNIVRPGPADQDAAQARADVINAAGVAGRAADLPVPGRHLRVQDAWPHHHSCQQHVRV